MKLDRALSLLAACLILGSMAAAQTSSTASALPRLVRFSGTAADIKGNPMSGVVGITIALYSEQTGGASLWMETQNVQADSRGHYAVLLGVTRPEGLPADLFASGQARWVGVQVEGQTEQPRVLLLSVPYALKAGDAETIGGLPPSAFVLAAPLPGAAARTETAGATTAEIAPLVSSPVTGAGTVNFLPLWDTASDITSSVIFQSGSGATAKIGINTTTPAATLDVKGGAVVRGQLQLPSQGAATASAGFKSDPLNLLASSFNSGTATAVSQTFQWQAEPAGNDTTTPSGTLNLLFGSGVKPAETGLNIAGTGLIKFATGQTFPGTGTITGVTAGSGLTGGGTNGTVNLALTNACATNQVLQWNGSAWVCAPAATGTITGLTAGTDLTGGGSSGNVTLNLDTTKVPQLNAANTFTQTQVINAINPFGGVLQASSPYQAIAGTMTSNDFFTPAILGNASATGTGTTIGVEGLASTTSGYGVYGIGGASGAGVYGSGSDGVGVLGNSTSGAGVSGTSTNGAGVSGTSTAGDGVLGQTAGAITAGVDGVNTGSGYGVLGRATGSSGQGVWGESFGNSRFSSSIGADGVHGVAHSNQGSGVAGVNYAQDGTGVYGSDTNGYGFVTDSHVSQDRAMGGWVKAMVFVNPFNGGGIKRCFNSQLPGSQATTVPCGMTYIRNGPGLYVIDFGFKVDDRFLQGTNSYNNTQFGACVDDVCADITPTQVAIFNTGSPNGDAPFYLAVF
jgi:hypothetical protein